MYRYGRLRRIPYPVGWGALLALVAALSLLVARLDPDVIPNLATHATVSASSGHAPNGKDNAIIDGDIWHVGFQTERETEPFIQLDFGSTPMLSRVIVYNRVDCCQKDETPLAIELSTDGKQFETVATTDKEFEKWDARVGPRTARYLRVRLKRSGDLLLNEIEVR
jgi:hypothetical protein